MSVEATKVNAVLAEMRIQGLGVIDEATLNLHPGLTVVTGETGAGKTMVVSGLHLLSGGRADGSRVRSGSERAVVEGRFRPAAGGAAAQFAEDSGAEFDEDGTLIAMRSVSSDGRSRAHLGGRSVPAGVLAELADALLAVHGQNDQLRLLRSTEQRALLDRFAGDPVGKPLAEYQRVRTAWLAACAEVTDRRDRAREMVREADMLKHGLAEIASVAPQPGEDNALLEEARRLADADQLREAAAAAQGAVSGALDSDADLPGALGMVGEARRRLQATDDPQLRELDSRLVEAAALLTDVGGELISYLDQLDADPGRLEQVLARQAELKHLTRKYAADADGVIAWAEEAEARLSTLDTSEEAIAALIEQRDALAVELAALAQSITAARIEAAGQLGAAVTGELTGLAMAQAVLEVGIAPREGKPEDDGCVLVDGAWRLAAADGVDEIELRLIAHPGAPALPINKGASGGELSRVMLALEVVLADSDPVSTMVFDEVDAGVGGRAAVEIGKRLARLARTHQVVVVTHLAQVAAFADRHLIVDKTVGDAGLTRSGVRVLDEGQRVVELARMLAGLDSTETGRAHAEELLATAADEKRRDVTPHRRGTKRVTKKADR